MDEDVEAGALEAVLVQELVLAECVVLGERRENCLAGDVGERHDYPPRDVSIAIGIRRW